MSQFLWVRIQPRLHWVLCCMVCHEVAIKVSARMTAHPKANVGRTHFQAPLYGCREDSTSAGQWRWGLTSLLAWDCPPCLAMYLSNMAVYFIKFIKGKRLLPRWKLQSFVIESEKSDAFLQWSHILLVEASYLVGEITLSMNARNPCYRLPAIEFSQFPYS